MEILACTNALQEAISLGLPPSIRRIVIRTDSTYVVESHTFALFEWPKRKWLRMKGAPVENAVDWKEFRKAYTKARDSFDVIRIKWISGKSKNPHIRAAHRLAQASARNAINPPRKIVHVRKKHMPDVVDRGSVKMEGQTFTIRIRASQILEVQKLWRCHYEVVSEDNPYAGKADIIMTDMDKRMDAGHTYVVRVNDNSDDPRIVEIIREVLPRGDADNVDPENTGG